MGIRKPHPEIFLRVLRQWGLSAPQVVMIGDSLGEDILGAQQTGMHQIWLKENVAIAENQPLILEVRPEKIAVHLDEVPMLIDELSMQFKRNSNHA